MLVREKPKFFLDQTKDRLRVKIFSNWVRPKIKRLIGPWIQSPVPGSRPKYGFYERIHPSLHSDVDVNLEFVWLNQTKDHQTQLIYGGGGGRGDVDLALGTYVQQLWPSGNHTKVDLAQSFTKFLLLRPTIEVFVDPVKLKFSHNNNIINFSLLFLKIIFISYIKIFILYIFLKLSSNQLKTDYHLYKASW